MGKATMEHGSAFRSPEGGRLGGQPLRGVLHLPLLEELPVLTWLSLTFQMPQGQAFSQATGEGRDGPALSLGFGATQHSVGAYAARPKPT